MPLCNNFKIFFHVGLKITINCSNIATYILSKIFINYLLIYK